MPLPDDTRIDQIRLTVSDVDRSVAFYRDTLGFTVRQSSESRAELAVGDSPALIELHEQPDAVPRPRRAAGLYHFAILVPSRAALGRSLGRLAERQWPITGASDHLVSEAVYLDDPDGLGIEIYRDRPRASWTGANGEIAMATDPLDLRAVMDEPGADAAWTGLDRGTTMGHVHLQVSRLPDAEALYCGDIGFTPMLRRYRGALFVAAGGYHHHLGLNTWAGAGAPAPPANAVGLAGVTVSGTGLEPRDVVDPATRVTWTLAAR